MDVMQLNDQTGPLMREIPAIRNTTSKQNVQFQLKIQLFLIFYTVILKFIKLRLYSDFGVVLYVA